MRKKGHKFPEGQMQTHIVESPEAVSDQEGKKPTDVRVEEMTKVHSTKELEGFEQIPTDVYLELREKQLVVVSKFNLEKMKREPDLEMLQNEMAHWMNMVQKSLQTLAM